VIRFWNDMPNVLGAPMSVDRMAPGVSLPFFQLGVPAGLNWLSQQRTAIADALDVRYAPSIPDFQPFISTLSDVAASAQRTMGDMFDYGDTLRENMSPSLTFSVPSNGLSGMPGTRGTGPWGLQEGFASRLLALMAEVRKRGGRISVGQGWRSYSEQVRLKKAKPSLAATPGRSNHGWGLAADLVFGDARSRQLAHELAPMFGLRFPMSYEPWHIEPIGIRRAAAPAQRSAPMQQAPATATRTTAARRRNYLR
jgi:hypothetical protein